MLSFSTLLVSRITYVYPAFDSLRIFRHSSGPDKSGSIQSVIMIFGRNVTIDASPSRPSSANANSYGSPRNPCSSSLRENGEPSTARTRTRPPVLSPDDSPFSRKLLEHALRGQPYELAFAK